MDYKAFVYRWIDVATGKMYIGSHKGQENDGYICSSRYMMEEYTKRPNDFKREIISWHETYREARREEHIQLKSVAAATNAIYYNKSNGGMDMLVEYHTQETKEKLRKYHFGKWKGEKNPKYGVDVSGAKNPFYGKSHTDEYKKLMSESRKGRLSALKGRSKTEAHKKKLSKSKKKFWDTIPKDDPRRISPQKGIKLSVERRKKISIGQKGRTPWNAGITGYTIKPQSITTRQLISEKLKIQVKVVCENCGKENLTRATYSRWHGGNCRNGI